MASLRVSLSTFRTLFISLGHPLAKKWTPERCLTAVKEYIPTTEPTTECSNPELLKKLHKAIKSDVEILCVEDPESDGAKAAEDIASTDKKAEKPAKEEKAPPKGSKKAEKPAKEEKAPPKGSKKAEKPAKAKKPSSDEKSKPGILDVIGAALIGASSKNPVTKDEILVKLVHAFPERDAEKMKATVNVQVPSRMRERYDIQKNDKGYWAVKTK